MRTRIVIIATVVLDAGLLGANASIAAWSGSRAVLGQAIFAAADLVASALLLWGLHVSIRPADSIHPFGRGREMFFWAFVATLITFLAAGFGALVPGVVQAVRPAPIDHIGASLAVLGATLVASVGGIWVTLRELERSRTTVRALVESPHQGLKTLFYQDIVMASGCSVALGGLLVVGVTQSFWVDGVVASFEGALLVAAGLVLLVETRDFLVGRALPADVSRSLLRLVEQDMGIGRVRSIESSVLGPEEALVAVRIHFLEGMSAGEVQSRIASLKERLWDAYPSMRHVLIEPST